MLLFKKTIKLNNNQTAINSAHTKPSNNHKAEEKNETNQKRSRRETTQQEIF